MVCECWVWVWLMECALQTAVAVMVVSAAGDVCLVFPLLQGLDSDLGYVPLDFLPLANLPSFSPRYQLPQDLTYHKTTTKTITSTSNTSSNHKE